MHAFTILIVGILAAVTTALAPSGATPVILEDRQLVFNCSLSWVSGPVATANHTHPKDFGAGGAKLPVASDLVVRRTKEDRIVVNHHDNNKNATSPPANTLSSCCHWPRHCVPFLAGFADAAAPPNPGTEDWEKQICCIATLLQKCDDGPVNMIGSQMRYELKNDGECSAVTWEGEEEK